MATEYEPLPGMIWHAGDRFACPICGCDLFKVEIGVDPPRFWCKCGEVYTEESVHAMDEGKSLNRAREGWIEFQEQKRAQEAEEAGSGI